VRHIDAYRDGALARTLVERIAKITQPDRNYAFMEFCGGHTHTISRYGLENLLPSKIRLVHGPGCPVCVLPVGRLAAAIDLAKTRPVTLCVYGDLMRVPTAHGYSLLSAKADGADTQMIYSPLDAVRLAMKNPQREVVFFAIGFETTAPATAQTILFAERNKLSNFTIICNHVLTPPAMDAIMAPPPTSPATKLDGFIGPGHVATVTGLATFEQIGRRHDRPVVIAGFEPLDILQAILMLMQQVHEGRADIQNQYQRAVPTCGNRLAQAAMKQVFTLRDSFEWRGLGLVANSALRLREQYAQFDAERRYPIPIPCIEDHPACACGEILRGVKAPTDCRLFGAACTPDTPIGSCMVSSEGACAAHWAYGRVHNKGIKSRAVQETPR
jgi:hydrogenase expression/formation protein HypD